MLKLEGHLHHAHKAAGLTREQQLSQAPYGCQLLHCVRGPLVSDADIVQSTPTFWRTCVYTVQNIDRSLTTIQMESSAMNASAALDQAIATHLMISMIDLGMGMNGTGNGAQGRKTCQIQTPNSMHGAGKAAWSPHAVSGMPRTPHVHMQLPTEQLLIYEKQHMGAAHAL